MDQNEMIWPQPYPDYDYDDDMGDDDNNSSDEMESDQERALDAERRYEWQHNSICVDCLQLPCFQFSTDGLEMLERIVENAEHLYHHGRMRDRRLRQACEWWAEYYGYEAPECVEEYFHEQWR